MQASIVTRVLSDYRDPGPTVRAKPPTLVQGEVVRKQRKGDRLLLTVATPEGSILVTICWSGREMSRPWSCAAMSPSRMTPRSSG